MTITIYHNPACGTSRNTLAMIRASGEYKFERLPYGSYRLSVDYDNFTNEQRSPVTSVKDRPSTGNLVEIYEKALLTGRVVDAFSGDPLPEAEAPRRPGFHVRRPPPRPCNRRRCPAAPAACSPRDHGSCWTSRRTRR